MKCKICRIDESMFDMKLLDRVDEHNNKLGTANNPLKDFYCNECAEIELVKRNEVQRLD